MTNDELQHISDEIFKQFNAQNNHIDGIYLSPQTNKLLAFENYMAQVSDADFFVRYSLSATEVKQLRKFVEHGVEKYFSDNIKTLAIIWNKIWEKKRQAIVVSINLTYIL